MMGIWIVSNSRTYRTKSKKVNEAQAITDKDEIIDFLKQDAQAKHEFNKALMEDLQDHPGDWNIE